MQLHKRSKIAHLPPEDRSLILSLCADHTYDSVAEILSLPRAEGGLDLQISPAALCRFYTRHHETLQACEVTAQLARALELHHCEEPHLMLSAVLTLVEQKVFRTLCKSEIDLPQILPSIRAMIQLRKLRLTEAKAQSKHPAPSRPAWTEPSLDSDFETPSPSSDSSVTSRAAAIPPSPSAPIEAPPHRDSSPETVPPPVAHPAAARTLSRGLSILINPGLCRSSSLQEPHDSANFANCASEKAEFHPARSFRLKPDAPAADELLRTGRNSD